MIGVWYNGITHASGACNPGSIPGTPTKKHEKSEKINCLISKHLSYQMKIHINPIAENPVSLLRRAGYAFQRQENKEMSFVRSLGSGGYPRFHCYTILDGLSLTINLHLDQKRHTYGEATRHHGEYENDGPVKEEAARLLVLFGEKARCI